MNKKSGQFTGGVLPLGLIALLLVGLIALYTAIWLPFVWHLILPETPEAFTAVVCGGNSGGIGSAAYAPSLTPSGDEIELGVVR